VGWESNLPHFKKWGLTDWLFPQIYKSANAQIFLRISATLIVIENRNNEKAAMNAVSNIFPNAQRRGCRFHLGQSW